MKKNLKFLMLTPFLLAMLCESDDNLCGQSDPETYVVNVENITETYAVGETLWFNSETPSELFNSCNGNNNSQIILDNEIFKDGLFLLKLNNDVPNGNSEVFQDFEATYSIGEAFNGSYCLNAIEYLPELTEDNLTYKYRLGISVNAPGDYCIVNARNSYFNTALENNAQIFEPYNNLSNTIQFEDCGNLHIRYGINGYYFFKVE